MAPWNLELAGRLGKLAADTVRKKTVRSGTVPAGTPEARRAAVASLSDGLKPAAHVAPTRYGRKPYSTGTTRDST